MDKIKILEDRVINPENWNEEDRKRYAEREMLRSPVVVRRRLNSKINNLNERIEQLEKQLNDKSL